MNAGRMLAWRKLGGKTVRFFGWVPS